MTDDSEWFDWSLTSVEAASTNGPLYVNAVIYAELSVRYRDIASVDDLLSAVGVEFADLPRRAAFVAAKAFEKYRAQGGAKSGVLPEFFIGAHAAVLQIPLLTRDARRYRTYFPTVELITPKMN